jgi:LytS/YehU family sensor histidine kinase
MAIDLAQFFRRTLALSGQERIALAEEAALCESFLAVERRRLGDKLGFALRIDAEAGSCLVPPMMLQPLVENAVKHGIRQLDSGGVIVVEALTRGGWLHVAVENPAPEQPATQPGHGLGLRNIRERLTVQYGERARIAWQRDGARFRVELTLPAEQEGHR